MSEPRKYIWDIDGVNPPTEKRAWNQNVTTVALAATLEDALALCRAEHPDITFIKIQRGRNVVKVLGEEKA